MLLSVLRSRPAILTADRVALSGSEATSKKLAEAAGPEVKVEVTSRMRSRGLVLVSAAPWSMTNPLAELTPLLLVATNRGPVSVMRLGTSESEPRTVRTFPVAVTVLLSRARSCLVSAVVPLTSINAFAVAV